MTILTVSQINKYIKSYIAENKLLGDLFIKGEISNFVSHYSSGHFYFTLKDASSAIKCIMFKNNAIDTGFKPENGMKIILRGSLGVYERDGTYQIYATEMHPDGVGKLSLEFEALKKELSAKGYFDDAVKKPIPKYPQVIGVVTSPTGAVIEDITNVLKRRYPLAKMLLSPARVQGEGAEHTVIEALRLLDTKCDTIIIARGGGSLEDLWPFNSKELAEAVYSAKTPVISAVGHETDYTICDFTADLRAPTPSAAAELAVPSVQDIKTDLDYTYSYLKNRALTKINNLAGEVANYEKNRNLKNPHTILINKKEKLDFLSKFLYNNKNRYITAKSSQIRQASALLDSLSPLRVLGRGYCMTEKDEEVVTGIGALKTGDNINIVFKDGSAWGVVTELREKQNGR